MDTVQHSGVRRATSYILEVATAVAFCYFVLGGSEWRQWVWALFCVVAASVVVVNLLHDTARMRDAEYSSWHGRSGFAMIVVMLAAAVWQRSLWLLSFSLLLAWLWRDDLKTTRKLTARRSRSDV